MKLFGYRIDRNAANQGLVPGKKDEPFFYQGSQTGCLVLHGIGGTPANVYSLSECFSRAGFTVYAPLLPGHGDTLKTLRSSEGLEWLKGAEDGLQKLREAGCTRLYVSGLSLGGLLAGILAEKEDVNGCLMICPPVRMKGYLRFAAAVSPLCSYVTFPPRKDGEEKTFDLANMLPGIAVSKLRDIKCLEEMFLAPGMKIACPLFTAEAGRDNKVHPASYRYISRRSAHSLTHLYVPDCSHGCTYGHEREKIADAALAWIECEERNVL